MGALGLRIETKLQAKLVLTPEIKTAIELLQLPHIELEQRIAEELEQNPLLEWDETFAPAPSQAASADGIRREGTDFSQRTDGEDYDPFARMAADDTGLHAHLEWQVGIAPWPDAEKSLALDLIPMFGPDGYLRESDAELAAQYAVEESLVGCVRSLLQSLEPTGLGARNLAECLLLQLRERSDGDKTDLAIKVLDECCAELEAGDIAGICSRIGVDRASLDMALKQLRELDPMPGSRFRDDTADPIQPELIIEPIAAGGWKVEPYHPWSRRVRISSVMQRFQTEPESFSPQEREYIKMKARAAEFFLNSLKQRELTLLRVCEAILLKQHALLEHGPDAAVPLTLKDIAEDVGLHESTISRVTRRKYAITPGGLLELKDFFRQSVDGHTPAVIKQHLKTLIEQENSAKPLSDQVLANLLSKGGIDVARRTVAKYRMELNIPSRSERRQTADKLDK